jgi:hypothetical protein
LPEHPARADAPGFKAGILGGPAGNLRGQLALAKGSGIRMTNQR